MNLINPLIDKDDKLQETAENLMNKHREDIRKKAEIMLGKTETDIARMSTEVIQKLLFEFQVHQIELELQNEELNRAHRELSISRDRYAQLFNLSPLGYLTLNIKGSILNANLAAATLLGCSKEKLINRKLGEFINPADQNIFYFFLRDLTTKQSDQTLEARIINADKLSSDIECHASVRYNEYNKPEIWLTMNDITERNKAKATIVALNAQLEEKILAQTQDLTVANTQLKCNIDELNYSKQQIREREARLNSIFNASVEGIITIDTAGTIISANAAIKSIFDYFPDELIGQSISKLMPIPEKKQFPNFKNFLQSQIPEFISQVREVEGLRKDGSVVPLDLSVAEFTMDEERYFTGVIRDVSSRKLQAKLDKDHLEALAHVTRLGLMGEMASGIAHEVNQPLAAISSYTQACVNLISAGTLDLRQLTKILEKTHNEAIRAGQIIHRMREFVKSRKIYRSKVYVNALVKDAVSLCSSDFKQSNIKVQYELAKKLPLINVDKVQIEQVILNLLRNSIEAFKDLPPSLERKLTIRTYLNDNDYVEVAVKDNGKGIAESERSKVLTPFFTTKTSGMGMGLSISRSIVEAHQGVLYFNTRQKKGSTFYFTLPPAQNAESNDDE
ncbi:MAG: PAS domain S-box protein [Methylobacter sp.]|nr:PAS domain S-box protein [Methylobacter sp.]